MLSNYKWTVNFCQFNWNWFNLEIFVCSIMKHVEQFNMMPWCNSETPLLLLLSHSTKVGLLQIYPPYKNLDPRFLGWNEELRIILSKTRLSFPGCFILWMVRPLNLEELDGLITSFPFRFLKDANRSLAIGEIFLEIKFFMIDSTDRILEATTKLGDMEDVMNIWKVGWKLQPIREISSPS